MKKYKRLLFVLINYYSLLSHFMLVSCWFLFLTFFYLWPFDSIVFYLWDVIMLQFYCFFYLGMWLPFDSIVFIFGMWLCFDSIIFGTWLCFNSIVFFILGCDYPLILLFYLWDVIMLRFYCYFIFGTWLCFDSIVFYLGTWLSFDSIIM